MNIRARSQEECWWGAASRVGLRRGQAKCVARPVVLCGVQPLQWDAAVSPFPVRRVMGRALRESIGNWRGIPRTFRFHTSSLLMVLGQAYFYVLLNAKPSRTAVSTGTCNLRPCSRFAAKATEKTYAAFDALAQGFRRQDQFLLKRNSGWTDSRTV